ncbi:MAG: phasin family protein [Hyphomicrobiaceae bacterium]
MRKQDKMKRGRPSDSEAIPDMFQPNLVMATNLLSPMLSAHIAYLNWNAKYCERLAQAYKQWFDFVGHRLEEDASLAAQVQSAKDPKEVAQACSDFVATATKDYQAELSELTKLTDDLSNGAADALQDMSISPNAGATMGE